MSLVLPAGRTVAGVDGCTAGWIAIVQSGRQRPAVAVFSRFAALAQSLPGDAVIAVDMPIGLPERVGRAGRGPEKLVRAELGERQSAVFSIPARAAVYAETEPFTTLEAWYAAHRRASAVARATSDPPRAVSIQAFALFAKIRELDMLLRSDPGLAERVIESHPEAAFWRLAGGSPMRLPKKIKGRVNPAGMAERRALLARHGLPVAILEAAPPAGAGADDLLDAAAVLIVAARFARGEAVPFPDPPARDRYGLPIAIWT